MDDADLREAVKTLTRESKPAWRPPSIDERMGWGKHKDKTYREAALADPGFCQWAAKTIQGVKGQLCAEALALALGVSE